MVAFNPFAGMILRIETTKYELLSHQIFSNDKPDVFVVEGAEAFIYKMRNLSNNALWLLKVIKPPYHGEHIALAAAEVARYKGIPGLCVGNRTCLTTREHPELVLQFPELEYAILMPWLSWNTWAGVLRTAEASACYTRAQAMDLALATAQVLSSLEARHCAHTDIAGGNVACAPNYKHVELLDIENLYFQHTARPRRQSRGSPGYQHRRRRRQWCLEGDRFAGAILLAEMLTWWNPFVRAQAPTGTESLFLPEELQEMGSYRWQTVRDVLWSLDPELLHLFDQAWVSRSLAQCPDFTTWTFSLRRVKARANLDGIGTS